MSNDIHELLREIDKALEQVRAVGARDADLSLKLPLAARDALVKEFGPFSPGHGGNRDLYNGIPITEWTDGPFMSFSLDYKVIFDPTMPTTFYGKGVHDMVVELRNAPAKVDLTPRFAPPVAVEKVMVGDEDVTHLAQMREWKPGDSPVLPPIDDATKTAYAAIRIKASDVLPCPECGLRDGRHLACRTGEALDCIFRADIAGDIRTTDEPETVEVTISFPELVRHAVRSMQDRLTENIRRDTAAIIARSFGGKPKRSPLAAMMAARRAWAKKHRKPKPFTTEHDEGVHRAISAMQRPGRANEL